MNAKLDIERKIVKKLLQNLNYLIDKRCFLSVRSKIYNHLVSRVYDSENLHLVASMSFIIAYEDVI